MSLVYHDAIVFNALAVILKSFMFIVKKYKYKQDSNN